MSLQIGTGANQTGTFASINWANGPYFIKTETDPAGGTNYSITGTQELLSVPYALHAKTAENGITTAQANAITAMQVQINSLLQARAYPVGSIFCASGATQVVDVISPTSGKTWMDRNLGATQVATSSTDAAAYGDLYQWGRGSDGHQCRNSATITTLSSTDQPGNGNFIFPGNAYDWRSPNNGNLWQGASGINNPCPTGYRLPTSTELYAEININGFSEFYLIINNINFTASDAFASPLKLTVGGIREYDAIYFTGSIGSYWCSEGDGGFRSSTLDISSNSVFNSRYARGYGASVRCIKN